MRKISLLLTTALILLSSFTANAELNMGGKTVFTGTLIKILEPGPATQIQAIITNITDASVDKPYLIHLGPGVYNIGTTGIAMKEWVRIQGSGQESTKITGAVSTGDNATVSGRNYTALTDLTIENTGGGTVSTAIFNTTTTIAPPRIERVTAIASGGSDTNFGVLNLLSSPTMTNVTISAVGGVTAIGVRNSTNASPTMTNVTVSASGGSNLNYGVQNQVTSSPTMTNVTASASGANSWGVLNVSSSAPFIQDSTMEGSFRGLSIDSTSSGTRVVNSKVIGGVTHPAGTQCRNTYKADLADVTC